MAELVDEPRQSAPGNQAGADDLQVLHPNRSLEIEGKQVTVREYGFVEGIRLRTAMQPLINDLYAITKASGVPEVEVVLGILGKHDDLLVHLMAVAADVEESWIRTLPYRPGKHLLYVWWAVNGPFFFGEATDRLLQERYVEQVKALAGRTSMPASSPVDTELQPPSV